MSLRVSCFGKLPFHREFLRLGLGSPAASWVVHWIERTHEAISRGKDAGGAGAVGTLSFAVRRPGGSGVIAGVVRQSSDGLRKHPVTFFVEDDSGGLEARWHLAPLALAGAWSALAELMARPYASLDELTATLEQPSPPIAVEAAESAWQAAVAQAVDGGPWVGLTGAPGDAGRHLALNLLAVSRAQREARSAEEGVSFVVPLAGDDDPGRLVRAGLWLDLFRAAAGDAPLPAIVLGATPPRLWAFYRPVEGSDLAALLSLADATAIDDLGEAWQALPPKEATQAAVLEALVAPEAAPLAVLAGRLQGVG